MTLHVYLSIYLYVYIFYLYYLSLCLSIFLSIYCLSLRLPIVLSIYQTIKPSIIHVKVTLPAGLTCSQCIFQFTYTGGNNWGAGPQSAEVQTEDCLRTTGKLGCGNQVDIIPGKNFHITTATKRLHTCRFVEFFLGFLC